MLKDSMRALGLGRQPDSVPSSSLRNSHALWKNRVHDSKDYHHRSQKSRFLHLLESLKHSLSNERGKQNNRKEEHVMDQRQEFRLKDIDIRTDKDGRLRMGNSIINTDDFEVMIQARACFKYPSPHGPLVIPFNS